MAVLAHNSATTHEAESALSLYHLLEPEVLANPYPLFHRLRFEDPVHWDPFLHAWVITRYADVVRVLHDFSAQRTPTPEQLSAMGLEDMSPIAQVMVRQMLFLDPPSHTRIRGLASYAFTPQRVKVLRAHILEITESLIDAVEPKGCMDVIADVAEPLPYTITAEMLGVPVKDAPQLKVWSQDFAEMLGNFQHNPERAPRVRRSVEEMTRYFHSAIKEIQKHPREGLIYSFLRAEVEGDHFTEDEVVANTIVTMVGGQETTTNLIGNGVLTLLRNPRELKRLRANFSLIPSAVEEMLRYEPPSQHTARLAPFDLELGGKRILKRQAAIAVMAAGNRDPERFLDPDRFDITRKDNRHLSFGWAAHFCFGAALARIEGQIAFETMLRRLPSWSLEPGPLSWRANLGLRGLTALPITLSSAGKQQQPSSLGSLISAKIPMQQVTSLAEVKRKLLESYARGEVKSAGASSARIPPRPTGEPAPLSLNQEQLWIQEQIAEKAVPYNESVTIKANHWLDAALIRRSLSEIIRRHEIWRTSYDTINGHLIQVVHPAPFEFPWQVVDLQNFNNADRDAELEKITTEAARQPFDLKNGPLLRSMLVRLTDTDQRLFLFAHLSILDGVSVYQILPTELAAIYGAFSANEASPLPELPIQYSDYAYWQRQWLRSEEPVKQLHYWREKLGGRLPILNWPSRSPKSLAQRYRGTIHSFALHQPLAEALKQLSRGAGVTLFTVLVACFSFLLYSYTRQVELVVGTPSSGGRKRSEVRALLGYFLNPLALRINLRGNPSFQEMLLRIQEVIAEAISYDDIPIEFLARDLRPNAGTRNPFFSVAISLQPQTPVLETGWQVTSMDVESGGAIWDIYLVFLDTPDGLVGRVQYNPDLADSHTIVQMLQHLQELMESLAANPRRPLSSFDSHTSLK